VNPVLSSTPEKNCFEMVTAKEPYKKKSYHSKIVPSDAAKISRRSSVRSGNEPMAANGTERISRVHSLFVSEHEICGRCSRSPSSALQARNSTLARRRKQLIFSPEAAR